MSCTIRPVRPEDYVALAPIFRAAMPGSEDAPDSLQEDDSTTVAFERFVAEADGQVVFFACPVAEIWAQLWPSAEPGM